MSGSQQHLAIAVEPAFPLQLSIGGVDARQNAFPLFSLYMAAELHRLTTKDASDGSSAENVIQNIETNVPPGSTH